MTSSTSFAEVLMPRLSDTMTEGVVTRWLKAEGEAVIKGDPIAEIETEKVTIELEAPADGTLLRLHVPAGGAVPTGGLVALIGPEGSDLPDREPEPLSASATVSVPTPALVEDLPRSRSTPLARRLAIQLGVELGAVGSGSGPSGRILRQDVERAAASAAAAAVAMPASPGEVELVRLTPLRKTIVRRLTEAWTAPAFQLVASVDMARALEVRARLVERHPDEQPTMTDVLTKVCALALTRHPNVNALFIGDAIELHPSANIGIAVATDRGLVVPVIAGCERRTVAEIATARADIIARAREGKLQKSDLEGGTFTLSNLGMYGVEQFISVLNPPQAAILAVGAIEERPVVRKGQIVSRPMLTMTLSCDHRVLDGAAAADFLRAVEDFLEEPGLTL